MSTGSLQKTQDGIRLQLTAMVARGRSVSTFLDRVIWPQYVQAQQERWMSENSSQGARWPDLTEAYAKRKRRVFAAYPGAGNAMMIATEQLAQAVQDRGQGTVRIITDTSMTAGVEFEPGSGRTATGRRRRKKDAKSDETQFYPRASAYSAYAAAKRPFMFFSDETIQDWTQQIAAYVMNGTGET